MSYLTGRLYRTSLRVLELAALAGVAAGVAFSVWTLRDERQRDAQLASALSRFDVEAQDVERDRPRRVVREPAIPGNAADDYDFGCPRLAGDGVPRSDKELAALTAAERHALERGETLEIVDRFVRAGRREDIRFEPLKGDCWFAILRRPILVRATALAAADRGALDLAWDRAAALVTYGVDTVGRAGSVRTMIAANNMGPAIDVMDGLVDRAEPAQARRWLAEVRDLRKSFIGHRDIPIAVAASSTADLFPLDRATPDEIEGLVVWLGKVLELIDSGDVAANCVHSPDMYGLCDVIEDVVTRHTRAAERLAALESRLEKRGRAPAPSRL